MKITIITVVLNNEKTIRDTIESVLNQTYKNIEYIIVDGYSTDNTMNIINEYKDKIDLITQEHPKGVFDSLNKGIELATGDVIGFIHSDDFYLDNLVIQRVFDEFQNKKVDSIFADLLYIKNDNLNKAIRYYSAKHFTPKKVTYGIIPPHPTFFVKSSIYKKYGLYKTDYKVAGDYEMFVRLLYINKISYSYINLPIIKMRIGGLSTGGLKSKLYNNKEVLKSLRDNGVKTNYFVITKKYPIKILEIIKGSLYNALVAKKKLLKKIRKK